MNDEPMAVLISRSSLGGYAWCSTCRHPDLNHSGSRCDWPVGVRNGELEWCFCWGLQRMTPEEWLAWKYPDGVA